MASSNGNGWQKKSWSKGLQMFAADVAGNAADMLFLRYQDSIDKALPFLKDGFKKIMYVPFKILQSPLELIINKAGSGIEGEQGRVQRMQQSSEQRLDGLLEAGYHYTAAGLVGLGTLMAAEKGMSRLMGTGHVPNSVWWRVDFPVHMGTAAFLGTKAMAPVTDSIKGTMKKLMVAAGWTDEKAEMDARFAVAYILPNYLTLIPTAMGMSSMYYGVSKGVLHESGDKLHSNFHTIAGKNTQDVESVIARNMLELLKNIGAVKGPVKAMHG